MYRLLIVDDEPFIREGLKLLIDWEQTGFAIVGEASNGKEGLARCQELYPDLILVDIRMPAMDGLEMIEQSRRNGANCRFIILTGYSDFQYARRAIDNSVSGYLLKPIQLDELTSLAVRMRNEIDCERMLRDRAVHGGERERERYLEKLLSGGWAESEEAEMLRDAERLLGPEWRVCQLLLVEIEHDCDSLHASYEMKERLREYIRQSGIGYSVTLHGFEAVLVKRGANGHAKLLMNRIRKELEGNCGGRIKVYAGPVARDPLKLASICAALQDKAANKFLQQDAEYWIEVNSNASAAGAKSSVAAVAGPAGSDAERPQRLVMAVDAYHSDLIRGESAAAIEAFAEEDGTEASVKLRTAMLYLDVYQRLLEGFGELKERLLPLHPDTADWNTSRNLEELRERFAGRLLALSEVLGRERPNATFRRILDFIHRHYHTDIKLEMLAELFHYNSGYLGKLFRQQTGEYFKSYLDRIRVEAAKELLSQGVKVQQAAAEVGYLNVEYFNGKFKKYVGMPPSAYRISARN
jgi:two-component system response regulator YesN